MPRYLRPSDRGSLAIGDLRTNLEGFLKAKDLLANRLDSVNPTLASLEDPEGLDQLQLQLVSVNAASQELKRFTTQLLETLVDFEVERKATIRRRLARLQNRQTRRF